MIITKTPYRVSFFGGGSDYPDWFHEHGGEVLSTTIDCYSYVTCRYLPGFYKDKYRVAYRRVENVSNIEEIEHPVVRASLKYLGIDEGLSIHHDGDLPACSGMGSSSTFTVGLLAALYAYKGVYCSPKELADRAIYIEQTVLQECVGIQDQIASAYGGFNYIKINQNGTYHVRPVILSTEKLTALQSNLMLVYTGQTRFASNIASVQVGNFVNKQRQLMCIQQLVKEANNLLVSVTGNLDDFGRLLDESWRLKSDLAPNVSTSIVDEIYVAAKRFGALGGKLLGAGGGGFVLLYVPQSAQQKVRNVFSNYLIIRPRFTSSRAEVIYCTRQNLINDLGDFVTQSVADVSSAYLV